MRAVQVHHHGALCAALVLACDLVSGGEAILQLLLVRRLAADAEELRGGRSAVAPQRDVAGPELLGELPAEVHAVVVDAVVLRPVKLLAAERLADLLDLNLGLQRGA